MGPIWGRQDPGGSHVGPMNFAIWVVDEQSFFTRHFSHGSVVLSAYSAVNRFVFKVFWDVNVVNIKTLHYLSLTWRSRFIRWHYLYAQYERVAVDSIVIIISLPVWHTLWQILWKIDRKSIRFSMEATNWLSDENVKSVAKVLLAHGV